MDPLRSNNPSWYMQMNFKYRVEVCGKFFQFVGLSVGVLVMRARVFMVFIWALSSGNPHTNSCIYSGYGSKLLLTLEAKAVKGGIHGCAAEGFDHGPRNDTTAPRHGKETSGPAHNQE